MTTEKLTTLELTDDEFTQILAGLYGTWDRLTDELSAGRTEDNPDFEQDACLWAIRGNQELLEKLTTIRPEYLYLVRDALAKRV